MYVFFYYLYTGSMTRPNFFLRSSRIRVDLLLYESIPSDKQEQYDFRAEKNLDEYWYRYFLRSSRNRVDLLLQDKPTYKREQYDCMAEKNWTASSYVHVVEVYLSFGILSYGTMSPIACNTNKYI